MLWPSVVCANWLKSSCIIVRIDNWQSDYTRIMATGTAEGLAI